MIFRSSRTVLNTREVAMKLLISGATGFVGQRLVAKCDQVAVLTRDVARARSALGPKPELFAWPRPELDPAPAAAFAGVDAVIHLAGDNIAQGRWTTEKKQRIRSSRIAGTERLVETIRSLSQPPAVLVSASAIGYYPSLAAAPMTEATPPGNDFLAGVCVAWENAALQLVDVMRVVTPRIGVVLGREGGALAQMLLPFSLGLGGRLGSGQQWMSWIHADDLVALLLFCAATPSLQGAVNAVAPQPVTNAEFTRALARALHRPAWFPVPAWLLKLLYGEMADALLFSSQKILPQRMLTAGFTFTYPDIASALEQLVGAKRPSGS
jgi:uncharacterized protein (TIGR01777 family)